MNNFSRGRWRPLGIFPGCPPLRSRRVSPNRSWAAGVPILLLLLVGALNLHSLASGTAAARDTSAEDRDIRRLLAAAGKRDRAWEWRGPVAEVATAATHGKIIAPKLLKLLNHPEDYSIDCHIIVDQQIQLVLCSIFDEEPEHGRTIYLVRTTEDMNRKVTAFWKARVEQFVREGK